MSVSADPLSLGIAGQLAAARAATAKYALKLAKAKADGYMIITKMIPNMGRFVPAACHYADGTFIPDKNSKTCAKKAPSGAKFTFWHPDLSTMHVWAWYPNPVGLFSSMNPLVAPFNSG